MIIVVSNRNIDATETNENLFGNGINTNGIGTVRFATATYNPVAELSEQWNLKILPKDSDTNSPSQSLFERISLNTDRPPLPSSDLPPYWLIFIHGFNKNMRDLLDECREIQNAYRVNILAFAWPSNPHGDTWNILSEVEEAKENAKNSIIAFDRILKRLKFFKSNTTEKFNLTLMCHSLGCYLFENWVKDDTTDIHDLSIFEHIILHQAAVTAEGHEDWINSILNTNVLITLNNDDAVLRWAQPVNGGVQLGQLDSDFKITKPVYIKFTDEAHVGDTHNLFRSKSGLPAATANSHIHTFARYAFKGLGWADSVANYSFEINDENPNVWVPKHLPLSDGETTLA